MLALVMSNVSVSPSKPPAYYLCSESECKERQSSNNEISIFESEWPPKGTSRILNPNYAMTKYRRSAAGVDATRNRSNPRSIDQLVCCLDQLEYILCYQQQPNCESFPKQTLSGTVSFVEDRIRAIQVDLTVSQQPSAMLQYRIARCHILILYLLRNQKTYPSKFGHQALSAALTNYWDDSSDACIERDDEVLCFMALQEVCQFYTLSSDSDSCLSNVLAYYLARVMPSRQQLGNYPKFRWALHLVHLAGMGQPRSLLRRLVEIQATAEMSFQASAAFAILCRACVASVVDRLRFQTLDQCNKAYMKGEKVKCQEIARLLYCKSAREAGEFANTMAGLTRNQVGDDEIVVFKVGPVQASDQLDTTRQDDFVFGSYYSDTWGENVVKDAWDDPEPTPDKVGGNVNEPQAYIGARKDSEGVLVPPPLLLYRVMRGVEV